MNNNQFNEAEYTTLRQENQYNISNISKYLIATATAYIAILVWALTNQEFFYRELFGIILYTVLLISLNFLFRTYYSIHKISGYIAIFHEYKHGRIGWHILNKEFDKLQKLTLYGHPGIIIAFLSILTLFICLNEQSDNMETLTGSFYFYSTVTTFILFLLISGTLYRRFARLLRSSLQAWVKVASDYNLLSEDQLQQLKSSISLLK